MPKSRYFLYFFSVFTLIIVAIQWQQPLTWQQIGHVILNPSLAESFDEFNFLYAHLPRLCLALAVGGTLGVVGSLMQQLTQNKMTSPLTLGTSSGAWLALIIVNVLWPDEAANMKALAAMLGAMGAFALIVLIAGLRNMSGLPMVIAGMVINLLLGSVASAVILLNQKYADAVFMWGAGDLSQNGWDWWLWLWPKLLLLVPLLAFSPRVLMLLRLGQEGAAARGLPVIPIFLVLMTLGIWLVSASITAVGLIGFIGLLTPNIARALGARTPKQELWTSFLLGGLLLLSTDLLAQGLTVYLGQLVPSGVTAAAIGAPALIWFSRRPLKGQDGLNVRLPQSRTRLPISVVFSLALMIVIGLLFTFSYQAELHHFAWVSDYQWQLRWPRALTAMSAGIALAIAGVILQRFVHNPLASPDIIGVSSGATFTMVLVMVALPASMQVSPWLSAMLGSVIVLLLLLWLGRRHQYAASSIILIGIALTASLHAFVQFCLAKANQDSYRIVQWLAGSTYRVTTDQAITLCIAVFALVAVACAVQRWLTLITIGRAFALGRGVSINAASILLLFVVALCVAFVTATIGPISFIGLIAPHLALMLGALTVGRQLLTASMIGATVMLWSDWLGQVVLFPNQIAAGTIVSIVGASYFLFLLIKDRMSKG